ncbi:MAG: RsmD family RNA methyltransferase, partial [Chloroflexi bacterium]|nr:RsmD family RNA methyltransferase [Chloroflexota bacterium]
MVRILAGEFRSRQLQTLPNDTSTRPFLSRVKESIFGMLHEWFADARVLDLFAGVGTVGLDAV